MQMSGNTILVTGGGSGIGLALATRLAKLQNKVIVAGRSHDKLRTAASEGLHTLTVDMMSPASLQELAHQLQNSFPDLNGIIHNAGIMRNENLQKSDNARTISETIATNLTGPLLLNDLLLPKLLKKPSAFIMTVSSGLAFTPLAMTPTYSATKAAIHSYTESLRYQLKGTNVRVLELVPPYVQTHLMGDRQAHDPMAMPLDEFIDEVMRILKTQPQAKEVLVQRVLPLRNSSYAGAEKFDAFFNEFNDRLKAARHAEV